MKIDKFYDADLKKIVSSDSKCTVYKVENSSGEGIIRNYKVFPGIEVCYNDMHIGYFDHEKQLYRTFIEINHCREGRFECGLTDGTYTYMEPGDLSVNCLINRPVDSCFPISHYHGISILIELETSTDILADLMCDISIDINKIKDRLCPNNRLFIMRSTDSIQHIFSELYTVPDEIKMDYLKLKVVELLLFLSVLDTASACDNRNYYLKGHIDTVKDIQKFLVDNLDEHFTQEELSAKFQIPLTAMKQCFKGVYGKPIYSYLKTYRMQEAAKLLKETDYSITQIAQKVGYENVGKFSTAFRNTMNILPSKYKKTLSNWIKQD